MLDKGPFSKEGFFFWLTQFTSSSADHIYLQLIPCRGSWASRGTHASFLGPLKLSRKPIYISFLSPPPQHLIFAYERPGNYHFHPESLQVTCGISTREEPLLDLVVKQNLLFEDKSISVACICGSPQMANYQR